MVIGVEIPPETDRVALECHDSTVYQSEKASADHNGVDNPDMHWSDGNPQQKQADCDFETRCAECVEYFAEEPVA